MLGTRTKQVYAYGKRGHRIVNVSETRNGTTKTSQDVSNISDAESHTASLKPFGLSKLPAKSHKVKAGSASSSSSESEVQPRRKKLGSKKPRNVIESTEEESSTEEGPSRKPLSVVSSNVQVTYEKDKKAETTSAKKKKPLIIGKGTPQKQKSAARSLKPASPVVDVEITVLDGRGKPVKREQRVSRPDVQVNSKVSLPSISSTASHRPTKATGKSKQDAIVLSDESDAYVPPVRTRAKAPQPKKNRIIVTSDEDSEFEAVQAQPPLAKLNITSSPHSPHSPHSPQPPRRPPVKQRKNVIVSPPESPEVEVVNQLLPKPSKITAPPPRLAHQTFRLPQHNAIHFSPLARRDIRRNSRVSTPCRSHAFPSRLPALPLPSLPTTSIDSDDADLSVDFSQLALSSTALRGITKSINSISDEHELPPPAYLKPLLEACTQTTPYEFSAFIDMFPFDPIVQTSHGGVGISPVPTKKSSKAAAAFQKIGEASFSEVFGIGDVVLKVIPLRDEEVAGIIHADEDLPDPSDAKDVLREIIVTRAMGEMCEGFVQLLRTYVVRGKYPSVLLNLWDEYDKRKGSESVRPDGFGVAQLYAIIVLPNGGPDLETFVFAPSGKNSWAQACSIFWQITRALSEAEDVVHFEHRDLHWGQILIKTVTHSDQLRLSQGRKVPMDHDVHGVNATVIDLGLSRMETGEADGLHFTVPDEEVFEGEGDYQWEVYRMMRNHNGNSWRLHRPLTNVMWLHYLLRKLLHEKKLRTPKAARKTPAGSSPTFTEQECYLSLVEMEAVLGRAVAGCQTGSKPKKGQRKTGTVEVGGGVGGPKSANEVLEIGVVRRWLSRF